MSVEMELATINGQPTTKTLAGNTNTTATSTHHHHHHHHHHTNHQTHSSAAPHRSHSATTTASSSATSSTPSHPHVVAPSLTWVCHANRELIRIACSKRAHVPRGILEPRYPLAWKLESPTSASNKKSTTALPIGSGNNTLLLQSQLVASPTTTFHISVHGTVGCGKTSTLHNLTGRPIPQKHMETSGMEVLDLIWPYKFSTGEVHSCEFLFWDSGATAAMQYKYIQTTPEQHASCCLYLVSCLDKSSWTHIQRKLDEDGVSHKSHAKLLVLTKMDERQKREVHEAEIIKWQEKYNQQYFPSASVATSSTSDSIHPSPSSSRSYTPGSLVVCKLANWPISNEPFFTRPVSSLEEMHPRIKRELRD